MNFKDKIKELRLEQGLSQTKLAENLSLSQSCITKLEAGTREPTGSTLVAYSKFFNVSTDYLIGNEEPARVEGISTLKLEPEEEELLRIYRNASRGGKNILLGNARNIEKNDEYLKKQRRA